MLETINKLISLVKKFVKLTISALQSKDTTNNRSTNIKDKKNHRQRVCCLEFYEKPTSAKGKSMCFSVHSSFIWGIFRIFADEVKVFSKKWMRTCSLFPCFGTMKIETWN